MTAARRLTAACSSAGSQSTSEDRSCVPAHGCSRANRASASWQCSSASLIARRPCPVSASTCRRRSSASRERTTRPRSTSPSMSVVMFGGFMTRRTLSSRIDGTPPLMSVSIRYWFGVNPTSSSAISTTFASRTMIDALDTRFDSRTSSVKESYQFSTATSLPLSSPSL